MNELPPTPEQEPDNLPQVLFVMCSQGWSNESVNVDGPDPTYLARISIMPNEAHEVSQAFEDELQTFGMTVADCAGHHLVVSSLIDNTIAASAYPNERELKAAYDAKYGELLQRWRPRPNDIAN